MTINEVVRNNLCMGCGVCAGVCTSNAIEMIKNDILGVYIPIIKTNSCKNCSLCIEICPGIKVDFDLLSKKFTSNNSNGGIIGPHISSYFSYSNNMNMRFHSSSGGLVTSLLALALKKKMITGALVTKFSETNPLKPVAFIARSLSDITFSRSSKYLPVSIDNAVKEIIKSNGKYAVVGLPCQIHAIRKLERVNNDIKNKIIFHFGLFCGHNNTFHSIEYFIKKSNIPVRTIKKLVFRDKGWPGRFLIETINGQIHEFKRVRNESVLKKKILFSQAFHRDFYIPRCLLCPDLTNELADISFGDAWNKRILNVDLIGTSLIITRNSIGEELFQLANKLEVINSERIDEETVRKSQKPWFKENTGSRIALWRFFGNMAPKYVGKNLRYNLFSMLIHSRILPYFTHNKILWPFLKAFAFIRFPFSQLYLVLKKKE